MQSGGEFPRLRYRTVAEEMRKVKATMQHPEAAKYVTHGLRKNATIELYLAGCDDEMAKAVTGHSGVEMLKKIWRSEQAKETCYAGAGRQKPHGTEQARNVNVSTAVSKNERKAKQNDTSH